MLMNMNEGVDYDENTSIFRALGDENRLKIIEMLSCGEICACEILIDLDITQSTLSHHMKILCDSSLAIPRRAGKWTYYSLNEAMVKEIITYLNAITGKKFNVKKENCVCKTKKGDCE